VDRYTGLHILPNDRRNTQQNLELEARTKVKVSQIKELLSAYSDDTELMIAFNDKENLSVDDDQTWRKAVQIYSDTDLSGFNADCQWAITEAEMRGE